MKGVPSKPSGNCIVAHKQKIGATMQFPEGLEGTPFMNKTLETTWINLIG